MIVWTLYAPLACVLTGWPVLGQTTQQEALIQALFGDLPPIQDLDANRDGALTSADILLLGPQPEPTATPTSTATFTPTPSPLTTETPIPGLLYAGTIGDLLPHGVGDQLSYKVTDPLGKITTETAIVMSEDAQGGFVLDDQILSGQQLQSHQLQSYTDTGSQLLFNSLANLSLDPHIPNTTLTCATPLLELTTPLIAGLTFSTTTQCELRYTNSGLLVGTGSRTDTFTPKEVVDSITVAAGTFTSVIHISGATNKFGPETDEIYIAPGVGIVLQLQMLSGKLYRHELVNGTIGGHPVGG